MEAVHPVGHSAIPVQLQLTVQIVLPPITAIMAYVLIAHHPASPAKTKTSV